MKRASLACLTLIAYSGLALAQTESDRVTVPLSDPSRPGTIQVNLVMGEITVVGRDIKDVTVQIRGASTKERPIPDEARGLRRLSQSATISVEEHDNRVEITSGPMRMVSLEIEVPKKTNLDLSTVNNGGIVVEGVDGELEISNVNGQIELTDVSGAVVAHTVNGRVLATLKRITPDKPMAFTSLNGVVDVTLPPSVKANLKLRTDNGSAFTDFELQMLPQPDRIEIEDSRRSRGRYRINVNKVIYGAVNGGGPEIEMRTFNGNIYLRKSGGSSSDTAATPSKR
jgi:DUF4097 and DUF4098 domain-containing protein YvlB